MNSQETDPALLDRIRKTLDSIAKSRLSGFDSRKILFADAHPDPSFARKQKTQTGMELRSLGFYLSYSSVYDTHPRGFSIGWLDTELDSVKYLRESKQYSFPNWEHVSDGRVFAADDVDIDGDCARPWDGSKCSPFFAGKFGRTSISDLACCTSYAQTATMVEFLHACGNEKYAKWCRSGEALKSGLEFEQKVFGGFEPETVYIVIDTGEMKLKHKKNADAAMLQFLNLKDAMTERHGKKRTKFRTVEYAEEKPEFELRQLGLYQEVQADTRKGRLQLIGNTHGVSWLTKKPEFTFGIPLPGLANTDMAATHPYVGEW